MKNVLVAIPVKAEMHPALRSRMQALSATLVNNNPGYNAEICIFADQVSQTPGQRSIFDRPAQARNLLIEKHLKPHHDYVLWIDSDLVSYTPDMIMRLVATNPDGVTAPLPLIEATGNQQDHWFYDVAAFVEKDQPVYRDGPHFGNVAHAPPYFKNPAQVVDLLSCGCAYIAPASLHRSGVQFEPTPFTDHFPLMAEATRQGMRICCPRFVIVEHAYLPKYKEAWHSEPMEIWKDFDFSKYGLLTCDGVRPDAGPPPAPVAKTRVQARGVRRIPARQMPRRRR